MIYRMKNKPRIKMLTLLEVCDNRHRQQTNILNCKVSKWQQIQTFFKLVLFSWNRLQLGGNFLTENIRDTWSVKCHHMLLLVVVPQYSCGCFSFFFCYNLNQFKIRPVVIHKLSRHCVLVFRNCLSAAPPSIH